MLKWVVVDEVGAAICNETTISPTGRRVVDRRRGLLPAKFRQYSQCGFPTRIGLTVNPGSATRENLLSTSAVAGTPPVNEISTAEALLRCDVLFCHSCLTQEHTKAFPLRSGKVAVLWSSGATHA